MTRLKKTELVFILDRSGSMGGLESDTIGGFNKMLEKQQQEAGEAVVTTVLFDDRYELLHDRIPLEGVNPLTEKDYYVRGWTALLDAVGKTIHKIQAVQNSTKEAHRADQVLFVIITDGYENSSREFNAPQIKKLIESQRKKGWEFIFLGANIDAVETAATYGIDDSFVANYHNDAQGIEVNFRGINEALSCYRSEGKLNTQWKEEIDRDYIKRG